MTRAIRIQARLELDEDDGRDIWDLFHGWAQDEQIEVDGGVFVDDALDEGSLLRDVLESYDDEL